MRLDLLLTHPFNVITSLRSLVNLRVLSDHSSHYIGTYLVPMVLRYTHRIMHCWTCEIINHKKHTAVHRNIITTNFWCRFLSVFYVRYHLYILRRGMNYTIDWVQWRRAHLDLYERMARISTHLRTAPWECNISVLLPDFRSITI